MKKTSYQNSNFISEGFILSRFSLTFRNKSEERDFLKWELPRTLQVVKRSIIIAIIGNLSFIYLDSLIFGFGQKLLISGSIRIALAALHSLILFFILYKKDPIFTDYAVNAGMNLFTIGAALIVYNFSGYTISAYPYIIAIVAYYLFFPIRFVAILQAGITASIVFLWVYFYTQNIDILQRSELIASFIFMNVIAGYYIRNSQHQTRKEYYDLLSRKEYQSMLEKEIYSRKELEDKLRSRADSDPLTGDLNRRVFFEIMNEEINRCSRLERTMSVLLFDIDNFKKINDTYGHVTGDRTLQNLSEITRYCIRKSDYFARVGGEEFMILLPGTNMADALIAAEKLRKEIEIQSAAKGIAFTVSTGICEYEPGSGANEMYAKADEAMYRAKKNGKNRVEYFSFK